MTFRVKLILLFQQKILLYLLSGKLELLAAPVMLLSFVEMPFSSYRCRVRAGEVAEEVARFCVQFMAVKEAADLFKLLKQRETETERLEKGGA